MGVFVSKRGYHRQGEAGGGQSAKLPLQAQTGGSLSSSFYFSDLGYLFLFFFFFSKMNAKKKDAVSFLRAAERGPGANDDEPGPARPVPACACD